MNMVAAASALDLLASTFGGCLDVPTGFVGTDEVLSALPADPLASDRVTFKAFKVGLCRLRFDVDKREVNVTCRTEGGGGKRRG